ncbi:hypothetical protein [Halomarina rubra]|uniref:Superfamily III holin-X n=1 Tax=Halomarina rubra TaxID=2071873 RepID=A0ABD6ASJ7_9EURY|nr:hypothetical protein [Halomarina rubra]
MAERVRHPRLFSAFRAALYLFAVALGALLALVGVGALLAILVVGAVGVATTGEVNLLAVGGLSVLVVAVVALALAGLRLGVRHVETRVADADRLPDPLDELTTQYVEDAIDERELERRLDGVLDSADGSTVRRPSHSDEPRRLEEERST